MIEFAKNKVNDETPVSMLTVGQLKKALFGDIEKEKARQETNEKAAPTKRYV